MSRTAPTPIHWHILTGEYPPVPGGVADYTRLVARALVTQGDAVTVWTPASGHVAFGTDDHGVRIEALPDHFGPRALAALECRVGRRDPAHRLFVQYVPHAFGWRGGNLPFCLWLATRPRRATWVMFHEVYVPIDRRQSLLANGLGVVTRAMASLVAAAASRIFVSIPAWERLVRPSAPPLRRSLSLAPLMHRPRSRGRFDSMGAYHVQPIQRESATQSSGQVLALAGTGKARNVCGRDIEVLGSNVERALIARRRGCYARFFSIRWRRNGARY